MKFLPTTEERYYEMLEVLPPAFYGHHGFLVGEPVTHRRCMVKSRIAPTYDAYLRLDNRYLVADDSVTIAEFCKLTRADIEVTP